MRDLALPADVGRDHRQPGGERFLRRDREALEAAHVQQRVARGEVGLDRAHPARQAQAGGDAVRDGRVDHALELRKARAVEHAAQDHERGVAPPREARQHLDRARVVLLRLVRADGRDEERARRDAQLRAHLAAHVGIEGARPHARAMADRDHRHAAARVEHLGAHRLGARHRERHVGAGPTSAGSLRQPSRALCTTGTTVCTPWRAQDREAVVGDEVRGSRRRAAPVARERGEEGLRRFAPARAHREPRRRLERVAARMQHGELGLAAARDLGGEPLEHDALRAARRERGDQHPQRARARRPRAAGPGIGSASRPPAPSN